MPKSNFHRIVISLKHFYTMKTFLVSNFLQKEHLLDKIFSLYLRNFPKWLKNVYQVCFFTTVCNCSTVNNTRGRCIVMCRRI